MGAFAELDPRPDLADAVKVLADSGRRMLALTMGAAEATRGLLERAGVANLFEGLLSCDSISVTKPDPAVYELALEPSGAETWMVPAHAWDIAGPSRAGLPTAFITSVEGSYLDAYPKPDVVADSLLEAARAMVQR
jgi:2-haloacid dehalogenase